MLTQLPSWVPMFAGLAILVAIVGAIGLILLFRGFRELRRDLTEEVRRELKVAAEPAQVAVQEPLIIQEHDPYTPLSDHNKLKQMFDELIDLRRRDISAMHTKIELGLRLIGEQVNMELGRANEAKEQYQKQIAVLQTESAAQIRQLILLATKVDDLPEKILRILQFHNK